jgi:6-pyruvoyltetrahydropterin/6-carboxytetrahydropterin synthase
MRTVYISRKVRFCASHRYHNPAWSDAKNREVFGPCNNAHGHGHNYELVVTVSGEVDPETGMILNLREIDDILQAEVVARLDHRHLNEDLPEWSSRIPTTENLAIDIWQRIAPIFRERNAALFRVRIYESPDLYAEYHGETPEGRAPR